MQLTCYRFKMKKYKIVTRVSAISALLGMVGLVDAIPPKLNLSGSTIAEYVGTEDTDRNVFHGNLRHAVGVHRIQALRANRTYPPESSSEYVGWTYNHAPMMAYWQGRYWVEYVSNLKEEHGIPGRTAFMSSSDGFNWTAASVAFPAFNLQEIQPPARYYGGETLDPIPAGRPTIMHQRMGWYVAPDDRLLMIGFYGYVPSPSWAPIVDKVSDALCVKF